MLSQRTRHILAQKLFWNPLGARVVDVVVRYEQLFDVVVRNYSLGGETNGERWLPSLLGEAPVVFDVGFHDGATARAVLEARPLARVTGFDPSRFALEAYRSGFADDGRVSLENIALSSEPGETEFFDYENMCSSLSRRKESLEAPSTYRVPVSTLDAYCDEKGVEHIDFLKVDAEGYDLHVLEGATRMLGKSAIAIVAFEFASGWAASRRYLWEAVELFSAAPYRLFRLFNGFLCPLEYDIRRDSCCTLSAMIVAVSEDRLASGDIPIRHYRF